MAKSTAVQLLGLNEDYHPEDEEQSSNSINEGSFSPFWDSGAAHMGTGKNNLHEIANSPGVNAILGGGDALRNMMSLGLYKPESSNFGTRKGPESSEGGMYEAGKLAGDVGGFIGGGELLDLARGAGEGIPLLGKGLQKLGGEGILSGGARRLTGSAIGGAAENGEDRLEGAKKGLLYGGLGEAAGNLPKALGGIAELMVPQKYTRDILSKINEYGNWANNKGEELYKKAYGKFLNYPVGKKNLSYLGLSDKTINALKEDPILEDFHELLTKNPRLNNLKEFQTQLGYDIRALRYKKHTTGIDTKETAKLRHYDAARSRINDDIENFLGKRSSKNLKAYNIAQKHYATKVTPLEMSKLTDQEILGKLTPENLIKESNKPIKRIIENEPGFSKKTTRANVTDYLPYYLNKHLEKLENKINNGHIAQAVLPALLTGAGAHAMGGGLIGGAGGAIGAGLGSAKYAPEIIKHAQKLGNQDWYKALSKYLEKGKEPTKKAFTAYMAQGK